MLINNWLRIYCLQVVNKNIFEEIDRKKFIIRNTFYYAEE